MYKLISKKFSNMVFSKKTFIRKFSVDLIDTLYINKATANFYALRNNPLMMQEKNSYIDECFNQIMDLGKKNKNTLAIMMNESKFILETKEGEHKFKIRFFPGHISAFIVDQNGQIKNSSIISFRGTKNSAYRNTQGLGNLQVGVHDLFSQEKIKIICEKFNINPRAYDDKHKIIVGELDCNLKEMLDIHYVKFSNISKENPTLLAFLPTGSLWLEQNKFMEIITKIKEGYQINLENSTFAEYIITDGTRKFHSPKEVKHPEVLNGEIISYSNCNASIKAIFGLGQGTLKSPSTQAIFFSLIKHLFFESSEEQLTTIKNFSSTPRGYIICKHKSENEKVIKWEEEEEGTENYEQLNKGNCLPKRLKFS